MLVNPETVGYTYELAGPRVYTVEELVRMILRLYGRRRLLVSYALCRGGVPGEIFRVPS